MKKKIRDFYAHKDFRIQKMTDKRPSGVPAENIPKAAEVLYNEIQNGLDIKDISIPRRVWSIAKQIGQDVKIEQEEIKKKHRLFNIGVAITLYIILGIEVARWLLC